MFDTGRIKPKAEQYQVVTRGARRRARALALQKGISHYTRIGDDPEQREDWLAAFFVVPEDDFVIGGETFQRNDVIIGDLDADNIVYKEAKWQVRHTNLKQLTLGHWGLRIAAGGLGLDQQRVTVGSGTIDLDYNGDYMRPSYLVIETAAGNFSLNSIVYPTHQNQILFLKNESANNMTIVNGGAPPSSDYWTIDTQTGAAAATTGPGIALFIGNETRNTWELVSIRG